MSFEEPYSLYPEKPVRFSLANCNTKEYCIKKMQRQEIQRLYKRLGFFEQINYKTFFSLPCEKGFSPEKKGTGNFKLLKSLFAIFDKFGHIRVNGTGMATRVFLAVRNDLLYILLIDRTGEINH
jgi:hypothetical protein